MTKENTASVPLGGSISTQERNHDPLKQPLWRTHLTDKYLFRHYLVDGLNPVLGCILYPARASNCP
jgi:hypothetical protein